MKFVFSTTIVLLASCAFAQSAKPEASKPEGQAWLKQLVGEWEIKFKIYLEPDQPPTVSPGTDTVRALGDHWIISESKTTMMGRPYNGILSLGYNAEKKRFGGTYIDSFGGTLWVYKGTLNEAADTLTLETKGPSMENPEKTARYREVIQIKNANLRTFTSSIEGKDGRWTKIVSIEYRRKQE